MTKNNRICVICGSEAHNHCYSNVMSLPLHFCDNCIEVLYENMVDRIDGEGETMTKEID